MPLKTLRSYRQSSPHTVVGNLAYIPVGFGESVVDIQDLPKVLNFSWSPTKDGYARAYQRGSCPKTWVLMHHLILPIPEGLETDHRNGDRLDNRRENLRVVSVSTNQRNLHASWSSTGQLHIHSNGAGSFKVRVLGKHRGTFVSLKEAKKVRDQVCRQLKVNTHFLEHP